MIRFTMKTTALVTTTGIIMLGIYDLICVTFGDGVDLSVSQFLVNTAFNAPVVVFAFGFVCGHLFGRMKAVSCGKCGNVFEEGKE